MSTALAIIFGLTTAVLLLLLLFRRRRVRVAPPEVAIEVDSASPEILLNAFPDPFFIVDAQGVVLHANQAAATVFGPPPPVGRPILETLRDVRLAAPYRECRDTGLPVSRQIPLPAEASPDRSAPNGAGENLWLVDAAAIPDSGEPPQIRLLLRDLSAGHRLDQIRKDFVANASHELRTPITLVDGYLETFLDAPEILDDRETSLRYLGIMRKHTGRSARIIEDMLLISRIEAGDASALKLELFSLHECVQDIVDRLEALIREQQAEVRIELHDPAATLHGDRFYWAQILFNLIENALKQNPQPGLKVVIGSELLPGELRVLVTDNGIGIPAADLPFIFKRFYRVEKHHSQNQIKGTGLGLSIVKRAVEAHGGTITCESAPGIRTVFRITLPHAPTGSEPQ
jgi:signal transduction histidine kinase